MSTLPTAAASTGPTAHAMPVCDIHDDPSVITVIEAVSFLLLLFNYEVGDVIRIARASACACAYACVGMCTCACFGVRLWVSVCVVYMCVNVCVFIDVY